MRIDIENVTKRFGAMAAVSEVNLSIEEGELFTLLGPSGCGKTTLLRLIAGFYAPDEGEIRFDGQNVNDVPPNERGIGMVFQNFALWPHMTVYENAAYGLKLRRLSAAEIAARVDAVFEKVRLTGLGDRYPGQLSGGQQQRVALARALVLNPKILLLDEPLSNLDAKIRVQVQAGDPQAAEGARHHDDVRDARPGRGADAVGSHRGVQSGQGVPGRAAEGALRAAGQPLRGRLHRHQQPDRRHRSRLSTAESAVCG